MAFFLCLRIKNLTGSRLGVGLLNLTLAPWEQRIVEVPEQYFEPGVKHEIGLGIITDVGNLRPQRKLLNDLDRLQAAQVIEYEILKTVPDDSGAGTVIVWENGTVVGPFSTLNLVGDDVDVTVNSGDSNVADISIPSFTDSITARVRENRTLVGAYDSANRVYTLPDGDKALHLDVGPQIKVYHGGRRLTYGSLAVPGDYVVVESSGVGTGFDTIILTRFAPRSNRCLVADYYLL